MANENVAELTFDVIQSWSKDVMKEKMQNPELRPQIEEVIRLKNEQVAAQNLQNQKALENAELSRLARKQVIEEQEAASQLAAENEAKRQARMTREERIAEMAAKKAQEAEAERAEYLAKVAREREEARQMTMTEAEKENERIKKQAEEEQAEADKLAADLAEQVAAAQAESEAQAEAAKQEAEKKAAEEAAKTPVIEAPKPKQKIVREYQVRDDEGNPIGRPTHLEAETWEEMSEKQELAHANAMRLAERLRKRAALKPQLKAPEPVIEILNEEKLVALQADLNSEDELKATRAKLAIEINDARKEKAAALNAQAFARGQAVSLEFRRKNPDFNPCDANGKILTEYIQTNNLEWTVENLEIAYAETESQLAPRIAPAVVAAEPEPVAVVEDIRQEPAAANPTPAPAPVVAPAPAAVVPTPVEAPPAAANPPAQARKLPAAGIEPGSLHGARPTGTAKPVELTKQDVAKMSRDEYKRNMRNPEFVKKVNALFGSK